MKIKPLLLAALLPLMACQPPGDSSASAASADILPIPDNLAKAEAFIDAFYSFDAQRLQALLSDAGDSAQGILWYQGWADGGNYLVLLRQPCNSESSSQVSCAITVQDDPVLALHTGFNVTDTFHLTFTEGALTHIETSSNDQPIYYQARQWVEQHMPQVMQGPCSDESNTPADCARAMTLGYAAFYDSLPVEPAD